MRRSNDVWKSLWAITIAVLLVSRAANAQVGFARQDYPAGTKPAGVATADLNGDGHPDVVAADRTANNASVLLNKGDGTFGAASNFATGMDPVAVAVADFNGDSNPDLVTGNDEGNSISILLGNGDGTFQEHVDSTAGTGPAAVVTADFNGDGHSDVATANRVGNTVSVWLGNGDGTLSARQDLTTNTAPAAIVAGDFDGDGNVDLASANSMASNVSVLLGKGDGTFAPATDYLVSANPISLTSADFNLDSKLDLASANSSDSGLNPDLSLLPGNGDGTFASPIHSTSTTLPVSIVSADFDNDGRSDVAAASLGFFSCFDSWDCFGFLEFFSAPGVLVRLGGGDGSFGSPLGRVLSGAEPAGMAAGHFNGDGRIDLVVTDSQNGAVVILLQAPFLELDQTLVFSSNQVIGVTSPPKELTVSSTGSFPAAVDSVSLGGMNAADFAIVEDSCSGATLAVGSQCAVSVTFSPGTLGAKSATLTITDNTGDSRPAVQLSGIGVPNAPEVSFSPSNPVFGNPLVGASSSIVISLTNSGGADLHVNGLAVTGVNSGDFSIESVGSTCTTAPFTLVPGDLCFMQLRFAPSAPGNRTANLQVTSDAAGSPELLPLSGTGEALTIAPAAGSSLSATIAAGQTAIFSLSFSAGNATGTLSLKCTQSIPAAICVLPASVALNGTGPTTVNVNVHTAGPTALSTSTVLPPPMGSGQYLPFLLAFALFATLPMLGRRGFMPAGAAGRRFARASGLLILVACLWSGCGSGSKSSTPQPTPVGTYPVTVTATVGSNSQSVTLMVTVH